MKKIEECMLCGSKVSLPYYSYQLPNGMNVTNKICSSCGLIFQSPRYDFDKLKDYYEQYMKISQQHNADIPVFFEEQVMAIARMRLDLIKPFLKNGDRILDIGCSFGAMLKTIRDESNLDVTVPSFSRTSLNVHSSIFN
jgi:transcription elongation factor Elf1